MSGLLIFGCGKMGGAFLNGALKNGQSPDGIRVVEPNAEIRASLKNMNVIAAETPEPFSDFCPDAVFVAVKPFLIENIINDVKAFTDKGAVLLSIVAGRPVAWFEEKLGKTAAIVRAMPNTPAAVGRGITGIFANKAVSDEQKKYVKSLLNACGDTLELENENLMDAVTAVSGSGPAYVFYLTETLAQAAEATGLNRADAERLARSTVVGAAELMRQSPETPETLRKNVTTPNGTTAAALAVLTDENSGFAPLMTKAVKAAEKRSKELATA